MGRGGGYYPPTLKTALEGARSGPDNDEHEVPADTRGKGRRGAVFRVSCSWKAKDVRERVREGDRVSEEGGREAGAVFLLEEETGSLKACAPPS